MRKMLLLILLFPLFTFGQQTWIFDTKEASVGQPVQGKLSSVQPRKKHMLTSGDYLSDAATYYLYGAGLSLAGAGVALSNINDENADNSRLIAGGVLVVGGLVSTIVGHAKLVKAGKLLNEERKITLHPSSSGIGLALKF